MFKIAQIKVVYIDIFLSRLTIRAKQATCYLFRYFFVFVIREYDTNESSR